MSGPFWVHSQAVSIPNALKKSGPMAFSREGLWLPEMILQTLFRSMFFVCAKAARVCVTFCGVAGRDWTACNPLTLLGVQRQQRTECRG